MTEDLNRDELIALHVAQLIADGRGGGTARIAGQPEREDRTNPVVELVTSDTVGCLAIEHTLIESFTGQIEDQRQIQPYVESLPKLFGDDLPQSSRFDINVNPRAVVGVKKTAEALDAIVAWARRLAPTLPDGRPGVQGAHIARSGPPELPFEVSLARWPRHAESPIPHVTVGWWSPENLEELREARIATALAKKLPKIHSASEALHCDGVLVLEADDIQLANAVDIRVALQRAAGAQEHPIPAWIVLWETVEDAAFVSVLRANGEWIDDPDTTAFRLPHS